MQNIGQLIGGVSVALVVPWLIAMMLLSLVYPILVISVVLNIRGIHKELERFNNMVESHATPLRGGPFGV